MIQHHTSSKFNFIALCCWVRCWNSGHKSENLRVGSGGLWFIFCSVVGKGDQKKKAGFSIQNYFNKGFSLLNATQQRSTTGATLTQVSGWLVSCPALIFWSVSCLGGHGSVDRVTVKVTCLKFLSTNLGVHTDGLNCIWLLREVHGGCLRHGSTTCRNSEI